MARVLTLGQRCPHGDKMLPRGTFSQKKKIWEVLEQLTEPAKPENLELLDDVTGKKTPATYGGLCEKLRTNGRASLVALDGVREFQIFEGEMNELRPWDVDEEGKPRCNPVVK